MSKCWLIVKDKINKIKKRRLGKKKNVTSGYIFTIILHKCCSIYPNTAVFFFFLTLSSLEASLGQSEQRVCELSRALAQSEEQLSQLQSLSQSQSLQIQQLQDVCTQLSGVREMNEVSIREGICLI